MSLRGHVRRNFQVVFERTCFSFAGKKTQCKVQILASRMFSFSLRFVAVDEPQRLYEPFTWKQGFLDYCASGALYGAKILKLVRVKIREFIKSY